MVSLLSHLHPTLVCDRCDRALMLKKNSVAVNDVNAYSYLVKLLMVYWCFSSTDNQKSKQSVANNDTNLMVE